MGELHISYLYIIRWWKSPFLWSNVFHVHSAFTQIKRLLYIYISYSSNEGNQYCVFVSEPVLITDAKHIFCQIENSTNLRNKTEKSTRKYVWEQMIRFTWKYVIEKQSKMERTLEPRIPKHRSRIDFSVKHEFTVRSRYLCSFSFAISSLCS